MYRAVLSAGPFVCANASMNRSSAFLIVRHVHRLRERLESAPPLTTPITEATAERHQTIFAPRAQFGEAEAEHAARDADYEAEHHGSHGGIFHNTAEAVSHAQYAAGDKFKAKQHAGYVQVINGHASCSGLV